MVVPPTGPAPPPPVARAPAPQPSQASCAPLGPPCRPAGATRGAGESEPVQLGTVCHSPDPVDARNVAFNSSLVMNGEGVGVVIATGDHTMIGTVARLASATTSKRTTMQVRGARPCARWPSAARARWHLAQPPPPPCRWRSTASCSASPSWPCPWCVHARPLHSALRPAPPTGPPGCAGGHPVHHRRRPRAAHPVRRHQLLHRRHDRQRAGGGWRPHRSDVSATRPPPVH
jgi:hypothetical protein